MAEAQVDLLANAAATGAAKQVGLGGRWLMAVLGTFSGATVKVQMLGPDGSTYVDVPDASKTAAGTVVIYLPWGCTLKGVISGGPPSGIYLSLYHMEG